MKEGSVIFLRNDKTTWCKTFWWLFIELQTIWSNLWCHILWPHRVQKFLLTQGAMLMSRQAGIFIFHKMWPFKNWNWNISAWLLLSDLIVTGYKLKLVKACMPVISLHFTKDLDTYAKPSQKFYVCDRLQIKDQIGTKTFLLAMQVHVLK